MAVPGLGEFLPPAGQPPEARTTEVLLERNLTQGMTKLPVVVVELRTINEALWYKNVPSIFVHMSSNWAPFHLSSLGCNFWQMLLKKMFQRV